jgi:SAM-dependent methyltransferase
VSASISTASVLAARLGAEPLTNLLQVDGAGGADVAALRSVVQPARHLAFVGEAAEAPATDDGVTIVKGIRPGDAWQVVEQLDRHFGDGPLDAVVDHGAHHYLEARSLFEVAFPRLRTGGRYLILDWDWAHRDLHVDGLRDDEPALTNLVVELVMAAGTASDLVASVVVSQGITEVIRGDRPLRAALSLAGAYRNRGISYRPVL